MLTMKDFVDEQDPILRQQAQEVAFPLSEADQQLIQAMREYLANSQDDEIAERYGLRSGVGLAAPQVGADRQIFAVRLMDYDDEGEEIGAIIDQVFINPKLIKHSIKQVALKEGEGCLSVQRTVPGLVPRPRRVTFSYQDEQGERHEMSLRDYQAIVVQHEMDHLKGIMFYDHINEANPWQADENTTVI